MQMHQIDKQINVSSDAKPNEKNGSLPSLDAM